MEGARGSLLDTLDENRSQHDLDCERDESNHQAGTRRPVEIQPVGGQAASGGIDRGNGGNEERGPRQVADEAMAQLGPVGGIEEGARTLAGLGRQEIAVEGHDDEQKDVLGGRRRVADQDVRSLP